MSDAALQKRQTSQTQSLACSNSYTLSTQIMTDRLTSRIPPESSDSFE